MYKHYRDALAICRLHGNPQYFLTFTCNVKWPEITRYLAKMPPLKPNDRPDIIARVFQLKVESFMKYLRSGEPFGEVSAGDFSFPKSFFLFLITCFLLFQAYLRPISCFTDLYTIEFQKRGLPHCHTLLWVKAPFKIKTPADVDRYISAQIPDPTSEPVLHRIVSELMLHGPCGVLKPHASCMVDNVCSKHFPKPFQLETKFDKKGYVHYKRRSDSLSVDKNGVPTDDAFVVTYNPTLLLRFDAHINVEYCGWNMVIKYLFKYISKGADRVRFTVASKHRSSAEASQASSQPVDEIQNFVDGRYICPHEAAWRIFDFPIHCRNPAVQVLAVHLENMQNVTFRATQSLESVASNPAANNTLDTCREGIHLRYIDYPSKYTWDPSDKCWSRRSTKKTPAIGRLIYIHPSCGESFFLRMLLTHRSGCTSFTDVRTVEGTIYPTYRSACEALGLLNNDDEWSYAFIEASTWATTKELRSLFVHILLFCEVLSPVALWDKHWQDMADDVQRNIEASTGFYPDNMNDDSLQQYVLFELEMLLNASSTSSSISHYGLPMPSSEFMTRLNNRLLMEEKNYDINKLASEHELMKAALHQEQASIYNLVMLSVSQNQQVLLFVYGHGGTGKTYLWTTIISAIRASSKIVLAVAASGIASLLLPSGRTTHSRFKVPIDLTEESICYIKKNTQLGQLLIETSLRIWDEAPMSDRRCFESIDRALQDILGCPDIPFGGKSVLLGGDFRQTLPVIPKASKSETINFSLPRSYLWRFFRVFKLSENMRLKRPNLTAEEKADISWFSSWLLQVGDGQLGTSATDTTSGAKLIDIHNNFCSLLRNPHCLH